MTIQITGRANDFTRVPTGLFSLDTLLGDHLGNIGYPGSTITEWYGPPSIGKSTIVTYLAGKMSAQTGGKEIVLADLETAYEERYMISTLQRAGFTGSVRMVDLVDDKNKSRTHEAVLQETVDALRLDAVSVIIIDSVGAVAPNAELTNPLGSSNMGKRGQLMAQVSRRLQYHLRVAERPKFAILVNHQYDQLGKIGARVTPGGTAKSYAASFRITMYNKERFDYGDSHVALRTDKLRIGGVKKTNRGYAYIIPGYGVSPEMTAVMDCIVAGTAIRKPHGVLLNGTNYGRLRALRDKVMADDTEWAADFVQALASTEFVDTTPEDEGEEGEE